MSSIKADMAGVTVSHGVWVLPAGGDLARPEWRQVMAQHRAKLRREFGPIDRPVRTRKAFVEAMVFLYDRRLYDARRGLWRIDEFLDAGERQFGGYDQIVLWQSYPRLGLDERNQFDHYRDMPGGLQAVARWVSRCRRRGISVLLAYNPWDTHTRHGGRHLRDMFDTLKATRADGVYLDTMHRVPDGWTRAMSKLPRPIVFESEGNPHAEHLNAMQSTWGQGFTVSPPAQIFQTRWLFPSHKIFLTHHRHERDHWDEVRCALFTGTGVLVWENVFGNDTPWVERDKSLLRAVKPILRAFWRNFGAPDWEPFVPAAAGGLRVNRFPGRQGTVCTMVRTRPAAYAGPLMDATAGKVYVDLITGRELPVRKGRVCGRIATRSVGAVLEVGRVTDRLRRLLADICPGSLPRYRKVNTARLVGPAAPRPVRRLRRYRGRKPAPLPEGMLWIPPGRFLMKVAHKWHGCRCYDHPWGDSGKLLAMGGFAMDELPVTNARFAEFLAATGYRPAVRENFLKHWPGGKMPRRLARHPVVYVSLEDARAYAAWAGKRLPTEAQWQYAAQGRKGRTWPWGDGKVSPTRCNSGGRTTAVDAHPRGASPFGVGDLVGNVWQFTGDVYEDRVHRFAILKGGSFLRMPRDASMWYHHSGPCPLTSHLQLTLISPSLDRFSTVGFRCVRD